MPDDAARVELGLLTERVAATFMRTSRETGKKDAADAEILRIDAALAKVRAARTEWSRSPIERLRSQLTLTDEEVDFLIACVAVAIRPDIPVDVPAHDDLRRGLTLGVYATTVPDERAVAVSELAHRIRCSPLVLTGLLRARAHDRNPVWTPWTPSPLLVDFLGGARPEHPRVYEVPYVGLEKLVVDDQQLRALAEIEAARYRAGELILVQGGNRSGRRTAIASKIYFAWDIDIGGLDLEQVRTLLRDVQTLIALLGGQPVLFNLDSFTPDRERDQAILAAVAEFVGAVGVAVFAPVRTNVAGIPTRFAPRLIRWPLPDQGAREKLWAYLATQWGVRIDGAVITRLARRFPCGSGKISDAIAIASRSRTPTEQGGTVELEETELIAALRSVAIDDVGDVARPVKVRDEWRDLVLPTGAREQVELVIARAKASAQVLGDWGFGERLAGSAGTVVLLSGPPGTGKTMIAGLIARALDRELFSVDVSRVLSKWIGETEQRLARLFDAAETGHLALVFDEADALLAKRATVIERANDRFSNLEIAYLLDRLDRFSGVAFLTTNLASNLDAAVQRRLSAHIVVPAPGERERSLLWDRMLATGKAPLDVDIDAQDLARRFPAMAGGNIRNAVLGAAYLAATEQSPAISHAHLVRAGRIEYEAMGEAPQASLRMVPPDK